MENAKIYLCKADSSILGTLTGIQAQTCNLKRNATNLWELTFDVNRYIDTDGELVQSDYYDSLDDMMRLYLDGVDMQVFFVIDSEPVIKGDGYQETKSVTAHSIECELCNIYLKNFKINCGTPDSQEYLACDTDADGNKDYYNVNPYTGLPDNYISLVNYDEPQLSLLHLALQGTGWRVKKGLDTNVYLDKDHYFRIVIHTVKNPAGTSSQRITGSVKKRCDKEKNVYAVELQKWASSGIEFTTENLSDITIVAQSSNSTIRIDSDGIATNVNLPSLIALVDSDDTFYSNMEGLTDVTWNSKDENGIVLTYKNLSPGTYKIVSPYDFAGNDTEDPTVYDRGVQIKSITVSEHSSTSDRTVHKFQSSDLSSDADQEEIMGICQIKKSFETSDSIYSFFMKTVSPAASVIFEFDRKHKTIGIVKSDDYGEDTGVFITMRNLMNSFEVTSTSNDSIVTKLIPTGANNLGIEQVNFGKDYIFNLDYFMNTRNEYGDYKFVSKELHDKYNCWKDFREKDEIVDEVIDESKSYTRRELYIELTKLYNQTISNISELKNRVPNDGCLIDYKTYKLDELKAAYTAYNNALAALTTIYKNEYGIDEIGEAPDYTPIPKDAEKDAINIKETPYWHDFYAYKESIIPQVKEALKMYCKTDENGNLEFDKETGNFIELEFGNPDYYTNENIVKEVDYYLYEWSLYGLDELESKKKAWSEAANLLFEECFIVLGTLSSPAEYRTPDKDGWDSLDDDAKSSFTTFDAYVRKLNQYLDYMSFDERDNSLAKTKCKGIIRQCEDEIAKRTDEISKIQLKQNIYYKERKKLADLVTLDEHFKLTDDAKYLFTVKDINIINSMIREQEFSNENIITTSLDDIVTTVDAQEELYQSAVEELYKISQPQYSFSTELDNLYALDEFKALHKPFDIGNFIRVGLEIHEEICDNNLIKLRLISISHNPLYADENLSVEFSTMTRTLNGISDLAFLLDSETSNGETSPSSSSSSGGGTYGNNDANVQISNNMINALLSTELFGTTVTDVILDSLKANKGNFNTLLSHSGIFDALEAGQLKVNGDCLFDGNIKSSNFVAINNDNKSGSGSCFNLSDGTFESYASGTNYIKNDGQNLIIQMDNFSVDKEGNAKFNGYVNGGKININDNFIVDEDGNVTTKGTLKVEKTGTIAGWIFDENGFYKNDNNIGSQDSAYIGKDGISVSNYFIVDNDGAIVKSKEFKYIYSSYISINERFFKNDNDYTLRIKFDKVNINDKIYLKFNGWTGSTSGNGGSAISTMEYYIDVSNRIIKPIYSYYDEPDSTIQLDETTNILTLNISVKSLCNINSISTYYELRSITTYKDNYSKAEIKEAVIMHGNAFVKRFYGTIDSKSGLLIDTVNNKIIGGNFELNSNEFKAINNFSFLLKKDFTDESIDIFKLTKNSLYHNGLSTSSSGDNLVILDGNFYKKSSSSKRYKHSIKFLSEKSKSLTDLNPHKLYDINVVSFRYNDDYLSETDQRYQKDIPGFIAEDVYEKYPIACNLDKNGNPEMWDINIMFPASLKLIQEQHEEIELLKKELEELKQK